MYSLKKIICALTLTLLLVSCERGTPIDEPKIEHLSVEGFVRGVEITRKQTTLQSDIIAIGFEDGRVKFFVGAPPDMVKQGVNNKITFNRTYHQDGTFLDRIEGVTSYPEPKEPK
jgi:hypothetical protein